MVPFSEKISCESHSQRKDDFSRIYYNFIKKGWVHTAKGHDINGLGLHYRLGDEFLMPTQECINELAIFFRFSLKKLCVTSTYIKIPYRLDEPLTSRLKSEVRIHFVVVLMGKNEDLYLLASDRRL
ncbi:MAG: hypothetical protein AB8V73_00955 [Coxiella endosymbiont of Dermacentor nuttalli]